MALSDDEKARVKLHLGYPQAGANFTVNLEAPYPVRIQQNFTIDDALKTVTSTAEARVRMILGQMDALEGRMGEAPDLFEATRIGDINPNQNVLVQQERAYRMWGQKLADCLGVQPYSESKIYQKRSGTIRGVRLRGS